MTQTLPPTGVIEAADAGDRPVVTSIELFAVRVPFSSIARQAMDESSTGLGMAIPAEEPWLAGDFVLARLEDEAGTEGWGEVFVWLPETGVSPTEVMSAIRSTLARYVIGAAPTDVQRIRARMDRNLTRNEVAKGLLEMACIDLAARRLRRPVHDLIGGRGCELLPLCGLVPLADPDSTAAICNGYVGSGYGTVRIKLGTSPEADRDVIAAVRDAVGPEVRLRVDYNQAYDVARAARALRLLEPYGIDAAEQPLRVGDVLGMAQLQKRTDVPLFLHEGTFSVADVVTLIELGGCGVLGINAERPGGIVHALALIDYASARGMGTIIHNQPLGLGTAVLAHLAAARFDVLGHAVELAGDVMFSTPLTHDRPPVQDGHLVVPDGPGWGVEIDRDELAHHTVGEPVRITAADLDRVAPA